ncbi:hypothetical protein SHKM778_84220 [Streptomyces sp. KM77-8]|uniref:Cell division protein FtsK n=1 Tax=Streptomyces haneummycinicus TaxID=3074435 RepID=A0AAT9HXG5_9ACTN
MSGSPGWPARWSRSSPRCTPRLAGTRPDRRRPSRPLAERTAEWSWAGWLPHVRPAHGQDCRLLLAHDLDQAAARAEELLRRLEDHDHTAPRISGGCDGPYTVVVVDGDPGGAEVREAVARLALEGPRAGIHVVCLAETAAASPSSPVTETYEAACAVAPTFRQCGAVALLSGDVATTLRLLRVGGDGPVGRGTLATVDAVSPRGPNASRGRWRPCARTAPAGSGTRVCRHRCPGRRGCWTNWAWPAPPRPR